MKLLESKSSPATKLNQLAMSAGTLLGGSAATVLSVAIAMAEEEGGDGGVGGTIESKLVGVIEGLFSNVQGIAGPLFGLIILVCIVGMAVSIFNGNANGARTWKTGLISVVVLLILVYTVPTIVKWAADFGANVNDNTSLSSAFSEIGSSGSGG